MPNMCAYVGEGVLELRQGWRWEGCACSQHQWVLIIGEFIRTKCL